MLVHTGDKKVLFYLSDGKLYAKEKYTQPRIITEREITSFDSVCSNSGEIHIAAATKESSVLYICWHNGQTKEETLMVSKGHTDAIKRINLFEISGKTCVVFKLKYNEKTMLVYQAYDGLKSYSPEIIDYITDDADYCAAADKDGNIHIIYKNDERNNKYRIYRWSKKAFEEAECGIKDDFIKISAVFDNNDMHIVYTADNGNYVILCYTDNIKKDEQKIGFGIRRDTYVSVYAYNKNVTALWIEGKTVYVCVSTRGGQFSTPCQNTTLGRNRIWGRIRTASNPHKLYFESGPIDTETFEAINIRETDLTNTEHLKEYAAGERAVEYSKEEMLSALGSGELLKRLDAIELRLDGLMDSLSSFLNREE